VYNKNVKLAIKEPNDTIASNSFVAKDNANVKRYKQEDSIMPNYCVKKQGFVSAVRIKITRKIFKIAYKFCLNIFKCYSCSSRRAQLRE
jgi:hypothetical protein